jgi:hypothetical protein
VILGSASGRYRMSQISIIVLVAASAALNAGGQTLQQKRGWHDRRTPQT